MFPLFRLSLPGYILQIFFASSVRHYFAFLATFVIYQQVCIVMMVFVCHTDAQPFSVKLFFSNSFAYDLFSIQSYYSSFKLHMLSLPQRQTNSKLWLYPYPDFPCFLSSLRPPSCIFSQDSSLKAQRILAST